MQATPVVMGVVVISFLLTRALPGDPAVYFACAAAGSDSIEQTRVAMGLDKHLIQQFSPMSGTCCVVIWANCSPVAGRSRLT